MSPKANYANWTDVPAVLKLLRGVTEIMADSNRL